MQVVPATAERFDDAVTILGDGCLCQYWRLSSGDYNRSRESGRLGLLRAQLEERRTRAATTARAG